ncbi:hypothetical protein M0R45_009295 [Rubus argutus]|uniref:Cytochrome P450 n=1 Tax=Rubus argutus TaxID=59490 RepID=A0AAW1Y646_RUBAR
MSWFFFGISFAAGKRMCLDISFGTAIIELTLSQLLYFFNWKLPNGTNPHEFDMAGSFGMGPWKRNELNVMVIPFFP